MAAIVESADLPTDVAANAMSGMWIEGANARASRVAPCLAATDPAPTAEQLAEAKLVLIGAIMRWSQAGSGAFQSETIGPFANTVDTRQRSGYALWPSEIVQLQDICSNGAESQAFSVDTVRNTFFFNHLEFCSIFFGGACSCGASIAWQPIFEQ